jgi:glycosyltransferase involved in cell wall biosynthesis
VSRIAYIQYTNPAGYPPLEHSSQLLADRGWKVLFLGTGIDGVESLHFPSHSNIVVRQLATCRPGWRLKLHYAWFIFWSSFWTLCSGSSWVYASDLFACPVGLLLSFVPWIHVIYHEHDSPTVNSRASGASTRFVRFVLWTRRALTRRATLCVLPNEQRAKQFTSNTGRDTEIMCVWNCPTKNETSPARSPLNGNDLWILYHGSLVPSRLPTAVVEALALLPEQVKLRVIGYETAGHKGYVRQLKELATKLGIANRVEFLGAMPRHELLMSCGQCDMGLSLMPQRSHDVNEQAMTGASNKPFDYLACGLALLVSDLPDWRALYVDNGHALAVNPCDATSIATAVRWLLEHPAELRAMGERGRQRILHEWNYEQQFDPVLQRLIKQSSHASES